MSDIVSDFYASLKKIYSRSFWKKKRTKTIEVVLKTDYEGSMPVFI